MSARLTASNGKSPSPDWMATLHLTDENSAQDFAMAADGSGGFEIELTPAQTSSLGAGAKDFAVKATKGGQAVIIAKGRLEVLPDPTQAGDKRTQDEKDLAAVEKAIRDIIAGGAVQSYSIQTTVGQRQLTRMTLEELRAERRQLLRITGKSPDRWRPIKPCFGDYHHYRLRR
ncbi:MAG: hypothetical protein Q7Q71_15820 [Verrucomicrobiota bacterium JB023]|nr:hypothetical protein [Verrucomicrobiota bacterium JB023]